VHRSVRKRIAPTVSLRSKPLVLIIGANGSSLKTDGVNNWHQRFLTKNRWCQLFTPTVLSDEPLAPIISTNGFERKEPLVLIIIFFYILAATPSSKEPLVLFIYFNVGSNPFDIRTVGAIIFFLIFFSLFSIG
jgi:hypothetical protein